MKNASEFRVNLMKEVRESYDRASYKLVPENLYTLQGPEHYPYLGAQDEEGDSMEDLHVSAPVSKMRLLQAFTECSMQFKFYRTHKIRGLDHCFSAEQMGNMVARAFKGASTFHRALNNLYALVTEANLPNLSERQLLIQKLASLKQADIVRAAEAAIDTPGLATAHALQNLMTLYKFDPFLKKGQLAVRLLCQLALVPDRVNTSDLTVFADYRLPQVLMGPGFRLLEPSHYIERKLDEFEPLTPREVAAFRAATILAGEMLAERWKLPAAKVDSILFACSRSERYLCAGLPVYESDWF